MIFKKHIYVFPEINLISGNTKREIIRSFPEMPNKKAIILGVAANICGANEEGWYTANARCDDRDEFSEKVGADIVREKLDRKNHLWLARKFDQMHRLLLECANYCYGRCMFHAEKAANIEKDLREYYGRNE